MEIKLGCSFEVRGGELAAIPGRPSSLLGLPFDRPVVGYGGKTINTLRLWAAAAPHQFDFQVFSAGEFVSALAERLAAESLTRVLYPDDSTIMGQGLRFVQEYFLVACSIADLVRRFRRSNAEWSALPDKVAIQLNDTHPSMAVAELMRVLLDEAGLGWDEAWDLTRRTLAYTNHTLLPEALEKWPQAWFELLLPRHLQIILEIDRRLLDEARARFSGDDGRLAQISLVEQGGERKIRMANLAIVGSHSTNGVAAIHSALLRSVTVKDLAEMFPERFNNKTNGVTPRRWLLLANPALASCITEAIGDGWIADLSELSKLKPLADDAGFRDAVRKAKTREQVAVRGLAQIDVRRDRRSEFDLRQPSQAHSRIQAPALECPAHHRTLQSAPGEPGPRDAATHLLLRRQSGARLSPREARHQVHQQYCRQRSTAIRPCAAASRSCSYPSTASRWPSG